MVSTYAENANGANKNSGGAGPGDRRATEGNITLFNFEGKPGAVGRIPWFLKRSFPTAIVRFDLDIILTGHELWGAYEQVPSLMVYDLLRRPPLEGVSAFASRL